MVLLDIAARNTEHRGHELFCTTCGLARVHHVHPTQKGVALMRWLIRLVSQRGDVILDPFAGSGTTGVAALLEGRRFIGVELATLHASVARERLEAAVPTSARLEMLGRAPISVQSSDCGPLFGRTTK